MNRFLSLLKRKKVKAPKEDLLYCGRCKNVWDTGHETGTSDIVGFKTLVIECPKCHPVVLEGTKMKDVNERIEKLNNGDVVRAVIRHRSSGLKLSDASVTMISDNGELLLEDHSELNFNWEIISFEIITTN